MFDIPKLKRIADRVRNDVEDLMENGASRIRRSAEYVFSTVIAGIAHTLYGHQKYISDQIIPDRADEPYLIRHANWWGIEREGATYATFQLLVTGDAGEVIPAGTEWQRSDGLIYASSADATLDIEGEALVTVVCQTAGTDGNTDAGETLSLVGSLSGVLGDATVQGEAGETMGDATGQESLESLRERLRERVQTPPSGGGPGDFKRWAEAEQGISRAFEVPRWAGLGTVLVLLVQDTLDAEGLYETSSAPSAGVVSSVQAAIDAQAPITQVATVMAATVTSVPLSIALSPNTSAVRAAVTQELREAFFLNAIPGATITVTTLQNAIANAAGVSNFQLLSPTASTSSAITEILILGTITFSTLS